MLFGFINGDLDPPHGHIECYRVSSRAAAVLSPVPLAPSIFPLPQRDPRQFSLGKGEEGRTSIFPLAPAGPGLRYRVSSRAPAVLGPSPLAPSIFPCTTARPR
jgi:hypothetical protein